MNSITQKPKKVILGISFIFISFLASPFVARAEINMAGIAGVILQCTVGSRTSPSSALGGEDAVKTEADSTKATQGKESCGDAMAKYAITELLAKITQETLNWINSGFKGDPSFVQNPEAYLKSIATEKRTELQSLLSTDDARFPYGRAAMQAMVNREINRSTEGFARRATFTMNRYVPTGNVNDFYNDFRMGGWDAFFAQSFQQQNNPVGFTLLASEEEALRTEGEIQSEIELAKKELDQNDGFLNQKICSESYHSSGRYDPPETTDGGIFDEEDWIAIANDANRTESERTNARKHICKTWVTKTPGTVIAHALNKTIIDVPLDQAIAADEINESLNVIFSALMKQTFTNGAKSLKNLTTKVESGLGSVGLGFLTDPTQLLSGFGGNSEFFGGNGLNAESVQTVTQINPWLLQGSDFNLKKELPYIIYLQKRYIGDLSVPLPIDPETGSLYIDSETNEPIVDPTPGFGGIPTLQSEIYDTILRLEDLDFCIPGPSPFFAEKVYAKISWAEEEIRTALGSMKQVQDMLDPSGLAAGQATETAEGAIRVLYAVGNEFISKLNEEFRTDLPGNMPFVTDAARRKISDIPGYKDKIAENRLIGQDTEDTIQTLEYLQRQLDNLEVEALNLSGGGSITPEIQAQLELKADVILNSFYNIAGDLVRKEDLVKLLSEADSARGSRGVIESMTQQCKDERADPGYTGKVNQIPYDSISWDVITYYPGQSSGSVNHFLIPNEELDYKTDDVGAVIQEILAWASGGVLGSFGSATVFASLDLVNVAGFDGWGSGTSWFEDWTNIQ